MHNVKRKALLVLILLVILVIHLNGCKKEDPLITTETPATETAVPAPETQEQNELTVTYYDNNGSILKLDRIEKNSFTVPPAEPKMTYGNIFLSWDTDLSNISKDVEVRPICENIQDKVNAFVIPGAYGKTGENVMVPVLLNGNVCVAGFDITLSYDPEKLELVSVDEDGAVVYNDETPGQIRINYVSVENTLTDVDVVRIIFRILADNGTSDIELAINGIYACNDSLESNDDSMYVPESYILNGKVFIIP